MIDSQSVKAADTVGAATSGFDGGKKIKGRKRHVAVDSNGWLLAVLVTAASVQDRDGGHRLVALLRERFSTITLVWADGGYAGRLVVWAAAVLALTVTVVKRTDTVSGFIVLPRRWVVERTFGWLSRHRRLVRDYERRPQHHEAMVLWATAIFDVDGPSAPSASPSGLVNTASVQPSSPPMWALSSPTSPVHCALAQGHVAVDNQAVGDQGVPVGVGEHRLRAVQPTTDVGAEQPDLSGALRPGQEHVAVDNQPVGVPDVPVGVGEHRLAAAQLTTDAGAGQPDRSGALRLVQGHVAADDQPVSAQRLPVGVGEHRLGAVHVADVGLSEDGSTVTAKSLREVERVGHMQPSGGQPVSQVAAPQVETWRLRLGQIEPVALWGSRTRPWCLTSGFRLPSRTHR